MKIALINGSPKDKNSVSEVILNKIKKQFSRKFDIIDIQLRKPEITTQNRELLSNCNILVFAFPLYVDSIPSHLLNCLSQLETYFKSTISSDTAVYSIVNCGFFEGHQAHVALEIMENWCEKSGLVWGQGIGIGGGGMLSRLIGIPDEQGPKKDIYKAIKVLVSNIEEKKSAESIFVSPNIPRFLYKIGGEMGWRKAAKANGVKL